MPNLFRPNEGTDEESRREVIDSTSINASGELLVSHKD